MSFKGRMWSGGQRAMAASGMVGTWNAIETRFPIPYFAWAAICAPPSEMFNSLQSLDVPSTVSFTGIETS